MKKDEKNIIAVHCKGGKGRSGSLCCSWLLFSKECTDADSAMEAFALSRTDIHKTGKMQGVETPSQQRYIRQIDQLLKKQKIYWETMKSVPDWANKGANAARSKLAYPPDEKINIGSLTMSDFFVNSAKAAGRGALVVVVKANNEFVSQSDPVLAEDILGSDPAFELNVEVSGDVQISVFVLSEMLHQSYGKKNLEKGVRCGKEKGMLLNFFFHSAFVNKDEDFTIPIKMVDKACKNRGKVFDMARAKIVVSFKKELPRFSV